MPRRDFPRPRLRRDIGGESFTPGFGCRAVTEERRFRKPKGKCGKDQDEGGVLGEPNRLRGLSGGAAAAMDFEGE